MKNSYKIVIIDDDELAVDVIKSTTPAANEELKNGAAGKN